MLVNSNDKKNTILLHSFYCRHVVDSSFAGGEPDARRGPLMETRLFWICAANDKEIIHTFQSIGPIADLII